MDDTINGVTIERYAYVLAKMNDVLDDKEKCVRIAESEGISRDNWKNAHKGWQERMIDPTDMGKTASEFVYLWKSALKTIREKASNTNVNGVRPDHSDSSYGNSPAANEVI